MHRKFVKRISVRTFDELMQKMKEAKSLGFLVDVTQFSKEPALYDWSDEGVYGITLFEAVKEEEKRYLIKIDGKYLKKFDLSDNNERLESWEVTSFISAALEVKDHKLKNGEGLVKTLLDALNREDRYAHISSEVVK